jgi:non-ribosomal peptide synthetase-like protein
MFDMTAEGSLPAGESSPATIPAPAATTPGVTAVTTPGTLVEIFLASVTAHPARTALHAGDATLTYAQLAHRAGELAATLGEVAIGRGDRVAIRVPSGTAELYTAILGVLMAGAAYVPIDADDPADRVVQILEGSGACATVGPGLSVTHHLPAIGLTQVSHPGPGDDAWIIFTSGSTGAPKGVAVTHGSAAAFVRAESELWTVGPQDRVLAGLSVGFDASCEEIWLAWAHGAALIPAARSLVRSGAELGDWLRERAVTVVSTVPTLAEIWEESCLDGVRLLILGGEVCSDALAWRLAATHEVWNTYGPTEATVVTTAARVRAGEPVTIGAPLRGWEVAVLDEHGHPVRDGEPGELVIGGVGLGRYLDPALDRARYAPAPALGWNRAYRTGDIVHATSAGLGFVGRRDGQVKIGGRRIELGEIDAALTAVGGVRGACTTVRETAAGNRLLVGYVSGEVSGEQIRAELADRLPAALVPLVVVMADLPVAASGKVNRKALPWPPPRPAAGADNGLSTEMQRWLAQRYIEQLGPLPVTAGSDFFALGGTSLGAAKLASTLRLRVPAAAVADIYHHPRLGDLAQRLEGLAAGRRTDPAPDPGHRLRFGAAQCAGVLLLLAYAAAPWIIGVLVSERWFGLPGPHVGWAWLVGAFVLVGSSPGQALIVAAARRALIGPVRPGRHPRYGSVAWRVWFLERLGEAGRLATLAGTPWAVRYARLMGHDVGDGARLGTLPAASGLSRIGAGATLEGEVDMRGWWIDGSELVIDEVVIGAGARVGTRTLLMPGARIGAGAEIEPGSVIDVEVGAGELWSGVPARRVGDAGTQWPAQAAPPARHPRLVTARFAGAMALISVLPLIAGAPAIALLLTLDHTSAVWPTVRLLLELAPADALLFVLADALLSAGLVRALSRLLTPGRHADSSATAWALWCSEAVMSATRGTLFPLYSSLFTRPWLRLAGIAVGRRTEISTAVGLTHLTSFGDAAFAADDVVLAAVRARDGWLHIDEITVGDGAFLGNGALLPGGTDTGTGSLVGVLTVAPSQGGDGTSWLGAPALELPRRPLTRDLRRTVAPPRRLVLARLLMESIRILLPPTLAGALGALVFGAVAALGAHLGPTAMVLGAPLALLGAGIVAALLTAAVKWGLIGRYRAGEHPLWSFFVWRDEIVNSAQEQLAGAWLLGSAMGTPIMSAYLRLMGAKVGRGVYCETLTITEFDLVCLRDGAVVNRSAVVETHLFHDRVMQIGSITVGAGASLGPSSALLPDSSLGEQCSVGGRAVVMRGESLPAGTRWHGAPVVAVPR